MHEVVYRAMCRPTSDPQRQEILVTRMPLATCMDMAARREREREDFSNVIYLVPTVTACLSLVCLLFVDK